jgi:hypothetical protein
MPIKLLALGYIMYQKLFGEEEKTQHEREEFVSLAKMITCVKTK